MNTGTKIAEVFQTPGGTLVIRPRPGLNLPFTLAAVTRKQCDDSFQIEPLQPWITPAEAARLMGISGSSVLRLRDLAKEDGKPVVEFRRPTPFRIQVNLASVLAHLQATQENPEFWESCNPVAEARQSK